MTGRQICATTTDTAITQKIFCGDKPHTVLYLKQGFKVTPLFGVTSDFESPNQHPLNLHLQGLNVQSHHSLEGLTNFKDFYQFTGFQKHFYRLMK